MKSLYFIRHGESVANVGGECYPDREIPLTEKGMMQAEDVSKFLIEELNIVAEKIYVSEFLRTQQTALPTAQKLEKKAIILPELNEFSYLNYNEIKNLSLNERRAKSAKYWNIADYNERQGTDSFMDFNDRISVFLSKIKSFPDQSLIFCHGMWLGLLAWRLYNFPFDEEVMKKYRKFKEQLLLHNTAMYRLDISGNEKVMQFTFVK